jgi:hypothetical protein
MFIVYCDRGEGKKSKGKRQKSKIKNQKSKGKDRHSLFFHLGRYESEK